MSGLELNAVTTLGVSGPVVGTENDDMWLLGAGEHREDPDCHEETIETTQKKGMTAFSSLGRAFPQLMMAVTLLDLGWRWPLSSSGRVRASCSVHCP